MAKENEIHVDDELESLLKVFEQTSFDEELGKLQGKLIMSDSPYRSDLRPDHTKHTGMGLIL